MKRVLIIGAGVSGGAAYRRLTKKGNFDITILEAADYIGGRVLTKTSVHGTKLDLGA
jgi:monoamine oxidase